MAGTIHANQQASYGALHAASWSSTIDARLTWFSDIVLRAQLRTQARVRFMISKARLMNGLQGRINSRQGKALLQKFEAGPDGFTGGLSAANYQAITGTPSATATRDLGDLVALGALVRTVERGHTRNRLALSP